MFDVGLPVGELLLVALRALLLDALEQGIGGFQFVLILCAPLRGELALEGVFQQGLAIHLELGACGLQVFDALVQLGKQFLDFGNDAVLFVEWRRGISPIVFEDKCLTVTDEVSALIAFKYG